MIGVRPHGLTLRQLWKMHVGHMQARRLSIVEHVSFVSMLFGSRLEEGELTEYIQRGQMPDPTDADCDTVPYDPSVMDAIINHKQFPAGWIDG